MKRIVLAALLIASAASAAPAPKSPFKWHSDFSHGTSEWGFGNAWDDGPNGFYMSCDDDGSGNMSNPGLAIDVGGKVEKGSITFPNGHTYAFPVPDARLQALWSDVRLAPSLTLQGNGRKLVAPLVGAAKTMGPKLCSSPA